MANMQVLTLGEIAQLTVVRTPFYPVFLEAGLLGIFFVLVCTLVTLSFRRGVCSRAQSWIVVVTVMMFIVDGAHWGSGLALAIMVSHKARTPASTLPPISYTLQALLVNIQYINIMLSDIVIVWRTWLIWERHIAVLVVSAALYTMTSAAVLMSIMIYLQVVDIYEPTATQWTFSHFAILASSAGMNLWTVSLIAIRAWRHRRLMDDFFGQGTRRTKAEKALSLLVESGIVMSILLTIFMLAALGLLSVASPYINAIGVEVIGIHWTIVLLLVVMRRARANTGATCFKSAETPPMTRLRRLSALSQ